MWYPNYKKQYWTAHEKVFCWITDMPYLHQLFDKLPKLNESSRCQETLYRNCWVCSYVQNFWQNFSELFLFARTKTEGQWSTERFRCSKCWCYTTNGWCWWQQLERETRNVEFFLVDSEIENGRHRVYNLAMDTLDPTHLLEKLDVVFDSLKSAANLMELSAFCSKT